MREALDRHNLSRPNEAERMLSAEGVRMGSDPGENISPPAAPHTNSLPKQVLKLIELKLDKAPCQRHHSMPMRHQHQDPIKRIRLMSSTVWLRLSGS